MTDHGGIGGLVSSTDQRPHSIWTSENCILREQFTGGASVEHLDWRTGADGKLTRLLLRRSLQSHQGAA